MGVEAEMGVMCLPAKECQGPCVTTRSWDTGMAQILRQSLQQESTASTLSLDFWLPEL